jgi:hypothetical protein
MAGRPGHLRRHDGRPHGRRQADPLLYDSSRVLLVLRSDYEALMSEDYASAFERFAVALRLTARLAAAAPAAVMSMRRLAVDDGARRTARPAAKT